MTSARASLLLALALGVIVAGVAGAAPSDPAATATGATALVALGHAPRGAGERDRRLEAPPTASAGGPFSYPEDGSAVADRRVDPRA